MAVNIHPAIVISLHGEVTVSEQKLPARVKMVCHGFIPMVHRFDPQLSRLANVYMAAKIYAQMLDMQGVMHCGQMGPDEYVFVTLDESNQHESVMI